MKHHLKSYLIVVLLLALLPVYTPLLPIASPLTQLIRPVSAPSYINHTNLKDEYLITGHVAGFTTFPSSHLIFLHLYKKQSYTLFGLSFSTFNHFAQLNLNPDGSFAYSVPSGEYRLSPLTLPQHHIYFTSSYPLILANRHPYPITVSLPRTSFISFCKSLLVHNLAHTFPVLDLIPPSF